jgi:dienelactone hydrolase
MSAVIRSYQQKYAVQQLVLMGYSGGGTIATLVAGDLTGERFILTVAANLDTRLWTDQHGHLPLKGSLNPLDRVDELGAIPQLHLIGGADTTVPNNVSRAFISKLAPDSSRLYPDFDHSCCWTGIWESLLAEKPWAGFEGHNVIESPAEKPLNPENKPI